MKKLWQSIIETPIGKMMSVANDQYLYLLTFLPDRNLARQLTQLQKITGLSICFGQSRITKRVETAILNYFVCKKDFPHFPLRFLGSHFQKKVWHALKTIPFGKTVSYQTIAKKIKKPSAYRAVANAVGKNPFVLIIPCHRVIRSNGQLGGYTGGVKYKRALLQHEDAE